MEKELIEIIEKWLIKADRDLLTIKHEFANEDPITDSICFHAQQSVEKYLKAFLIYHQIDFPKTHDIARLLNLCTSINPDFINLKELIQLTDYAVELRYPDDFYIPDLSEAHKAFDLAIKTKDFIRDLLKL